MPTRIDPNERPVIVSFTILPSQKAYLEQRATELSNHHGQHVSSSTIIRYLIDQYAVATGLPKLTDTEEL
jgi:hypothetical protein